MVLTALQSAVMRCLARNRSETSYMAGGVVLNRDWPRVSDDLDIFHDTDEEIVDAARRDIDSLRAEGFRVEVDVEIYGCVEARVSRGGDSTLIQWTSETKRRFFPLVRDSEWGARLHQADLAVNKVAAAASRTKARDFVDLISIAAQYCPLGPLVLAASGKPPYYSPQRILDEIRRRGLSVPREDYAAVRGIPADWSPAWLRDRLTGLLDNAESYISAVPAELVGVLALSAREVPVEVHSTAEAVQLRRATDEPEVMPAPAGPAIGWGPADH